MSNTETIALSAHVSGTILDVTVSVGDAVATGDIVMTIESMKMHMPLEVHSSGVITAVLVEPGDEVDEGQPLAELAAAVG